MFKKLFSQMKNRFQSDRPIEVFVRHCHYSQASAHKTRFSTFSKERCFRNLLSTLENHPVHLTFLLDTFHPMEGEHFISQQTRYPVVQMSAGCEAGSFLFMLDYVEKKKFHPDTILYFLEDDYIHRPNWPVVLKEAFTLPGIDYVTLYDHKDKYFYPQYDTLQSRLFHTPSCHWRTTPSTTNTYAMRAKTLMEHLEIHRHFSKGRSITADHNKFLELNAQGAVLISSLPGYATHGEPEFASPCIDWEYILNLS